MNKKIGHYNFKRYVNNACSISVVYTDGFEKCIFYTDGIKESRCLYVLNCENISRVYDKIERYFNRLNFTKMDRRIFLDNLYLVLLNFFKGRLFSRKIRREKTSSNKNITFGMF